MDTENISHKPPEEADDAPQTKEQVQSEESIPVASTVFFGEPRPDFWDENFF